MGDELLVAADVVEEYAALTSKAPKTATRLGEALRGQASRYDRMVTMLRSLEWAGHDEDGVASCPECNWNKGSHDPKGCALDALLEEISR